MSLRPVVAVLIASSALSGAEVAVAAAADFTWKGPASDARWSVDANWVDGVAPTPNSTIGKLSFAPESPLSCDVFACATVENDIPGLSVEELWITDPRTKVEGNPLTLGAGGLHAKFAKLTQWPIVATPISLGAEQTWTVTRPTDSYDYGNEASLQVAGAVTGAFPLRINLDTWSDISFAGTTEVGPVTFDAPPTRLGSGHNRIIPQHAQLLASMNAVSGNPITVNHLTLEAAADLGTVHLRDGGLRVSNLFRGVPTAAGLTMDADSHFGIRIDGDGTERGVDYSSLSATGAVELAGQVRLIAGTIDRCFEPQVGDSYTLISTTGTLTGSFEGEVSGDRDTIYPGYQCPDASDRLLEYRYNRTSMPRTVEMVVVRSTDPAPTASEVKQPTLDPAAPGTSQAAPAALKPGTSMAPPGPQGSSDLPPRPTSPSIKPHGLHLEAAKLRLTNVPLTPTKPGTCPKRVSVIVTSGKLRATKRVPVKLSKRSCVLRSTLQLRGRLAEASKVRVTVRGSGVKTLTKTVSAATQP